MRFPEFIADWNSFKELIITDKNVEAAKKINIDTVKFDSSISPKETEEKRLNTVIILIIELYFYIIVLLGPKQIILLYFQ